MHNEADIEERGYSRALRHVVAGEEDAREEDRAGNGWKREKGTSSLRVRFIYRGFSRSPSARVRACVCTRRKGVAGVAKTESRRKLDYCRIVAGSKR